MVSSKMNHINKQLYCMTLSQWPPHKEKETGVTSNIQYIKINHTRAVDGVQIMIEEPSVMTHKIFIGSLRWHHVVQRDAVFIRV